MALHIQRTGFHLTTVIMEHEVWELLRKQSGKRTHHLDGQTLACDRYSREHKRLTAIDAIGVEDGSGVVDHLSLKIMYLLADDA